MASATISAPEARARADLYAFLAEVFDSHPAQAAADALRRLAEELAIPFPAALSLEELDGEYMELFVVPGPRYVAPYESVFRDEWELPASLRRGSNPSETGRKIKGLLMGESTLDVRECYLRAGLLPHRDLPDHIANELRLLACLSRREAAATNEEAGPLAAVRERFQRNHPLKWIGQLHERIRQRERLGYYGAAAQIAGTLLESASDASAENREAAGTTVEAEHPPALLGSRSSGCPRHGKEGKQTIR